MTPITDEMTAQLALRASILRGFLHDMIGTFTELRAALDASGRAVAPETYRYKTGRDDTALRLPEAVARLFTGQGRAAEARAAGQGAIDALAWDLWLAGTGTARLLDTPTGQALRAQSCGGLFTVAAADALARKVEAQAQGLTAERLQALFGKLGVRRGALPANRQFKLEHAASRGRPDPDAMRVLIGLEAEIVRFDPASAPVVDIATAALDAPIADDSAQFENRLLRVRTFKNRSVHIRALTSHVDRLAALAGLN